MTPLFLIISGTANGIYVKVDLNENSRCACNNCGKLCDNTVDGSFCSSRCMDHCIKK